LSELRGDQEEEEEEEEERKHGMLLGTHSLG
jgi:hypothetical protein